MKRLVGIAAPGPRHGKSTFAKHLFGLGWVVKPMAATLKDMADNLLEDCGFGYQERQHFIRGDGKEELVPGLDVTMRRFMQILGTEVGRGCHQDFWLRSWALRNEGVLAKDDACIVIDDIRRKNEVDFVKERGGEMVWLERSDLPPPEWTHASEGEVKASDCDLVLLDQTLDSLAIWAMDLHKNPCP